MAGRRFLRVVAIIGGFAISGLFGYLALRGVNLSATWHALGTCNYWWLVPSLIALAASVLVRVVRWRAFFNPERQPPLKSLGKATLIGFFFNIILPVRAGEATRVLALKHYAGTSLAETTATVVVERIFDVGSLIFLLFAFVGWFPHVSWLEPAALLALACLVAVVMLSLFARRASGRQTPGWVSAVSKVPGLREETIVRITSNVVHGLEVLRNPRQALAALGWTFLSWFGLGLSFWFLMIGFDLGLPPLAGLLVVIATGLAFIIPAAPAAVGVFEAAGLAVTSAYDAPRSQAFAYVLVLHLLNLIPYLLAGLLLLAAEARSRRAASLAVPARVRSRG
jgi:uncharacterized protein (TIRG00374 family)